MATFNDSLYVNFLTGADTVTPKMEQLIKYGDVLAKKKALGGDIGKQMNYLNKQYGANSDALKVVNGAMGDSTQKLKGMGKRFDMNTLSWMFGGMALQRVGLSMTRFLIPSMDKLEKLNTKGAKKVIGMSAAFEFLKISMFETLSNTGLFDNFVQAIIKGAIWFAELTQKNPWLLETVAIVSALAVALGTLAIGKGILMQVDQLMKLSGLKGAFKEAVDYLKTVDWSTLLPFLGKGAAITAGITLAGFSIYEMIKAEDLAGKIGFAVAGLIGTAGAIVAIFNPAAGIAITIVGSILFMLTKFRTDIASTISKDKIIASFLEGAGMDSAYNQAMEMEAPAIALTITQQGIKDVKESRIEKGRQTDQEKAYEVALNAILRKTEELGNIQSLLDESASKFNESDLRSKYKRINLLQTEIDKLMEMGRLADENFDKKVQQEQDINSALGENINKVLEKGNAGQAATEQEISQYTYLFAEQLKSKTETENLIKNIELFGTTVDTTFGDAETGVVGKFTAFGKQIILDNEYFTSLRDDIEAWASKVTTKIIKIKYEYEGKKDSSSDEGYSGWQSSVTN